MQNGQWALITGASAGIGEATAVRLAKAGLNLVLTARRQERLEKLARRLEADFAIQALPVVLDIQSDEGVAQFAADHHKTLQKLSILINNAGLARGVERIDQGRIEDWNTMVQTNVLGLLRVTRAVLPHLLKQGSLAQIINVGSVAGKWVYPGGAVYCATKFAVRALSEGMRLDLLGKPVRVTNIEPGMVETEFSEVRLGDADQARAVYEGMTPLSADDIAESIEWCLQRPKHVSIAELVIFPTDQASVGYVHRR